MFECDLTINRFAIVPAHDLTQTTTGGRLAVPNGTMARCMSLMSNKAMGWNILIVPHVSLCEAKIGWMHVSGCLG